MKTVSLSAMLRATLATGLTCSSSMDVNTWGASLESQSLAGMRLGGWRRWFSEFKAEAVHRNRFQMRLL